MQLIKFIFIINILSANILSVTAHEETTPRVAPDQPFLWGFKRAIENIDELLTLNKAEKTQKALDHAHERLLEIQKMYAAKKVAAAAKGEKAHLQKISNIKDKLKKLARDSQEKITLEKEVLEQENIIKQAKNTIQIAEIKGTRFLLKDQQNESITSFL